jgi:hypothetical protein
MPPSAYQKALKVLSNLGFNDANLVDIGKGYFTAWLKWTPALAANALEKYNGNNRKLKMVKVEQMKDDMVNGNWLLSHQGIAFGLDNELKDGQNRLSSIARAGASLPILTFIGVDDKVKQVIDQGVSRTAGDVAKFKGIEAPQLNRRLTIARAIEAGSGSHNISCSAQTAVSYLPVYEEAIDFIFGIFPKPIPTITAAPVMAVIARAWMYCKRNEDEAGIKRLLTFCNILKTGDWKSISSNEIVQKLRDNFMIHKYAGGSEKKRQYLLTEFVLYHYLNKKPIGRLREAREEYFPLEKEENALKAIEVF